MSEVKIVAVNGTLSLPIGWTLPVVQRSQACYVLGEDPGQGFPPRQLERLHFDGAITLLSKPAVLGLASSRRFLKKNDLPEFQQEMFLEEFYVFYRDRTLLDDNGLSFEAGVDLASSERKVLEVRHDSQHVFDVWLVRRNSLIHLLQNTCAAFYDQITELFSRQDWSRPFLHRDVATFELASLITRCHVDIAFSRAEAQRAIAMRGLVIQQGPKCHTLAQWLKAACKRWRFDGSLEQWEPRFRSIIQRTVDGSFYAARHQEAIYERALRLAMQHGQRVTIQKEFANKLTTLKPSADNLNIEHELRIDVTNFLE